MHRAPPGSVVPSSAKRYDSLSEFHTSLRPSSSTMHARFSLRAGIQTRATANLFCSYLDGAVIHDLTGWLAPIVRI